MLQWATSTVPYSYQLVRVQAVQAVLYHYEFVPVRFHTRSDFCTVAH